jgi:hypothetical protein
MTRTLSGDYLDARGAAFDAKLFLDPIVADFIDGDETLSVRTWLAFMAGSEWERKYRGARYEEDRTGVTPYMDLEA